jgi:lambda family phage tail tape measure protein
MSDIARLGIQVDSTAAQTAAERLRALTSAGVRTEAQMGSLGGRSRRLAGDMQQVSTSTARVASAITTFGRAMQGLALVTVARQVIAVADNYALMNARLALVTNSTGQLERVQNNLFAQAQKNKQSLGETTNLYTSLARATKDAGVTEQDLLKVTDAVGKSMLISGTNAQEASGALRQLGQAFASGTLRGDEFNSVNEQMPRLMEAIAKGMGRTTSELRAMAAAGELTTGSMIPALIAQLGALNAEAARMPQTFEQSLTALQNAVQVSIGKIDQAYGLTRKLAEGVETFSNIIVDPGLLSRLLGLDQLSELETKSARLSYQINKTIQELENYRKESGTAPSQAQLTHMAMLEGRAKSLSNQLQATTEDMKRFANQRDPAGAGTPELSGDDRRIANNLADIQAAKAAGRAWEELSKKHQTVAEKYAETAKKIRETGLAAGKSEAEIKKMQAAARPSSLDSGAKKAQREAEAAAKRLAQLEIRIGAKDLGSDIAAIQRALGDIVADNENANDRLEALRSAGLVDEEDYYARRKELLHQDARIRQAALEQEIARLEEEKQIAAERRDASGGTEQEKLEAQRRYNAEVIQLNRQIADSESEIERIRRKTNITEQNLETTQANAARNRIKDIQAMRDAAEDYLTSLERQHDLEIASMGQGNLARDRLRGLTQINEKYQQQLLDTTRERAAAQTQEQKDQLDKQIEIIKEFRDKALNEYDVYWSRLQEKQRDAATGAREAIANYIDEANDLATQTEGMFTNAFGGLEDAMADAATSGKLSFSNLLKSMQADMARFFTKQTVSMLLQLMGGAGSRGSSAFTAAGNQAIADQVFASGGTFMGGINGLSSGVYTRPTMFRFASGMGLMAEAGPEAVMPLKRGRNGKLGVEGGGGGGPVHNEFHINMPPGNSNQPSPMEMKRILTTVVERTMSNKQRRTTR